MKNIVFAWAKGKKKERKTKTAAAFHKSKTSEGKISSYPESNPEKPEDLTKRAWWKKALVDTKKRGSKIRSAQKYHQQLENFQQRKRDADQEGKTSPKNETEGPLPS